MAKNNKIPKVSIIILSYNASKLTREQLRDIQKLSTKGFTAECLVVDNGSTDNTSSMLVNYRLPNMDYVYLKNNSNLGFAEGNNVGIRYALNQGSDYVVLLNNDLILPEQFLQKIMEYVIKNKHVQILSPKMYFAKGYEFHKDMYKSDELGKVIWYAGGRIDWENIYSSHRGVDEVDRGQYDEVEETDFGNGACILIKREVFEKIGFFDKDFFLYWEDADFCIRAKRSAIKAFYFPHAYIWHKVSSTAGGSGADSNDYFLTRNRYYFALKYANLRAKFAVFRDTLKLMVWGRNWEKIGAKDGLLGVKGSGSWTKKR